jgi:hypothetical protein
MVVYAKEPERLEELDMDSESEAGNETTYIENININFFQIGNQKQLVTSSSTQMNASRSNRMGPGSSGGSMNRVATQQTTTSSSVVWEISPKKRSNAAAQQRPPLIK